MDKLGREILNNMVKLDILNFKDAETTARFNNGGLYVSATGRGTDMLILSLVLAKKILKINRIFIGKILQNLRTRFIRRWWSKRNDGHI